MWYECRCLGEQAEQLCVAGRRGGGVLSMLLFHLLGCHWVLHGCAQIGKSLVLLSLLGLVSSCFLWRFWQLPGRVFVRVHRAAEARVVSAVALSFSSSIFFIPGRERGTAASSYLVCEESTCQQDWGSVLGSHHPETFIQSEIWPVRGKEEKTTADVAGIQVQVREVAKEKPWGNRSSLVAFRYMTRVH